MEKGELLYIVSEVVNKYSHYGNIMKSLQKLKIEPPSDLVILLLKKIPELTHS